MIGIIPTIVTAGIALKFTDAALGKPKRPRKLRRGSGLSNKYSPF